MSNFTVNGVYTYTSSNIYSYLGRLPGSNAQLKEVFEEFNVTPTGSVNDLKKLNSAMYEEYSAQVKEQIDNQNQAANAVPWAGLCAKIGIQATGDFEADKLAFNNAIQLLRQSALDGQAMTYFAGLQNEASKVFGLNNMPPKEQETMSYYAFQAQYLK